MCHCTFHHECDNDKWLYSVALTYTDVGRRFSNGQNIIYHSDAETIAELVAKICAIMLNYHMHVDVSEIPNFQQDSGHEWTRWRCLRVWPY